MPKKPQIKSSSTTFTEDDLLAALISAGGEHGKIVAKNPKLLKATFDIIKSAKQGDIIGGISAVTSGANSLAKATNAKSALQTATKSTALVMSEFKATMDMTKVFKLTSPLAIGVYVGAATVQKTGLVVSFAGTDGERAKCVGAVMELAGSAAVTAVTAPTGVLLVLSAASLAASSYSAYQSCFSN